MKVLLLVIILLFSVICFSQDIPILEGLVAYYPFNGNANDESNNGNDGVIFGSTLTEDVNNNPNSAMYFDGDDFIEIPNESNFDLNEYTISLYFSFEDLNDDRGMLTKGPWFGNYSLSVSDNLSWAYITYQTNSGNYCAPLSGDIVSNEFYHLTISYSNGLIKGYINGLLERQFNGSQCVLNNGELFLGIGYYNGVNGEKSKYFKGVLDDIAIYNRVLSDSEILEIYEYQGTYYGDIDDNSFIQAYDASLVLNYVVGYDPLPEDPIPWENWREERADVDLNELIQAYDASLILNYVVGNIPELPWTQRQAPMASLDINDIGDELTLSTEGEFYSATLSFDVDLSSAQITPMNEDIIYAVNGGKLAIASPKSISGELLKIKISDTPDHITGYVNAREGMIEYGSNGELVSAKITSIYPNPFNPQTTISYQLSEESDVNISIYNIKGQLIEKLVDKKMQKGNYEIVWNAENASSGIYYLNLKSNNNVQHNKLLLLK